jgi:hypothetical protein
MSTMEKEHIYTLVTIVIGAIIRHFEKKHDKKKEDKRRAGEL